MLAAGCKSRCSVFPGGSHMRLQNPALVFIPSPRESVNEGFVLSGCPVCLFVCLSGETSLPWYLMNGLNNLNKTDREYSLAPTDDLIRFWRLKVKVTAGCQGQIMWTPYLTNYFSNFDETYREQPVPPTDDLIRFWRSKVKVTAGLSTWGVGSRLSVDVYLLL